MKEPVELHEDIARALRMLGQAAPPEGMEARIAGRLRQRQAELSVASPRRSNGWRWCVAVATVVAVVGISLSHRHAAVTVPVNRAAVELPHRALPPTTIARVDAPVHAVRGRRTVRTRIVQAKIPQGAPPLPLTEQEHLLLALARRPQLLPSLRSVTTSETIADHGLGKNAIFELDHQELPQLPPMPQGELK
jgi:hypothetical protein